MLFSFESLLFDENHSAVSNEKCNLKANFSGSSRGCIYWCFWLSRRVMMLLTFIWTGRHIDGAPAVIPPISGHLHWDWILHASHLLSVIIGFCIISSFFGISPIKTVCTPTFSFDKQLIFSPLANITIFCTTLFSYLLVIHLIRILEMR